MVSIVMLSVSAAISSLNLNSPLPSIFELVVSNRVEAGLFNFFKYAHMVLCERYVSLACTGPYCSELYLLLMLGVQKRLLWESETSFCEILMGLVRRGVVEKPAAYYVRPPFFGKLRWILPTFLFGPPPGLCAEERMMLPSSAQASSAVGGQGSGGSAGNTSRGREDLLSASSMLASSSSALEDGAEARSSQEQMEEQRSLYSHLRFTRMSKRQKVVSLLVIAVIPYVLRRAEAWHGEQVDPNPDAVEVRAAFARAHPRKAKIYAVLAKYIYPVFHVGWESLNFLFDLFYALELTPYTSPIHRLSHIAVRRLETSGSTVSPKAARWLLFVRVSMMLFYYSTLLVQWTSAEENRNNGNGGIRVIRGADRELQNMPIPPPPVFGVDTSLPSDAVLPTPGKCPVCGKEMANTTVLTTSGILGCYVCLHEYVQEHKMCPVTRQPTSLLQLRRIVKS